MRTTDRVKLIEGDCLAILPTLPADSFHAIVTDPPYGLEFMGKEWDGSDGFRRSLNAADAGRDDVFGRTSQKAPEFKTGANWQTGAGFSKPGIGERETPWPSFTGGNDQFGGANPTCATCGGRARGKKKCACAEPDWRVKGAAPDRQYGRHRQMLTYQEWCTAWAREALRVLKPGAHLLAFGGTRTYHRLVCAIEDAGFEIRDAIMWHYSTGFPKSHSVNKALGDTICCCGEDANRPKAQRDVRPVRGADVSASLVSDLEQGQVLFPPLPQSSASGKGIELAGEARTSEPSMEGRCDLPPSAGKLRAGSIRPLPAGIVGDGEEGWLRDGAPAGDGPLDRSPVDESGMRSPHRPQAAEQRGPDQLGTVAGQPIAQDVGAWPHCRRCGKPRLPDGLGTALKPATEIICVARKPLIGTVAANVLAHGCGALNIDGCRVPTADGYAENAVTQGVNTAQTSYEVRRERRTFEPAPLGRWPANVILSYPEDEYILRPDTTAEQRQELFRWLSENA